MAHNKVMIGNTVIMDITDTTATVDKVLPGYFYYDMNGDKVEGTCTYNANTSGDDVVANYVKAGVKFHDARGGLAEAYQEGTVVWNDTQTTITLGSALPTAQTAAYYNGIAYGVDSTVIKSENIKKNIVILGVTGSFEGTSEIEPTKYARAATDYTIGGVRYDTIEPSAGYDALGNVKVGKIWYQDVSSTGTTGYTANILSLTET